jgi:hypothetical protein
MKLGFYIENSGGTPQNIEIYNFLNQEVENGTLDDASVFFNSVNFNPINPHFGMFDAADLWHFSGNLITTSVDNTIKAKKVVNKFKIAYLFNKDENKEQTLFQLVYLAKEVPTLVTNQNDANELYRITGKRPIIIEKWSKEKIVEVFDEQA